MSYAIFQSFAIALILAWSLWFAARRLFPRSYRAAQARLAQWLGTSSNAALRALGAKLAPQQVARGAGCGNGGGCASCGTCAPSALPAGDAQPLVFHPRAKQ
ncbi:MAG: hypothetical protein JSS16_14060 [Proteobacteria bacterium]|uniref:DUF6587 family protein n=1 Tax=Rudaea sp. TaxID=2136325 RepID=UPI001E0ABD14|nr:hypothetical protein [Pseudomonadota bacterium]MBS0566049.1 hypothetical protein [Pseudomonadota bacterium]